MQNEFAWVTWLRIFSSEEAVRAAMVGSSYKSYKLSLNLVAVDVTCSRIS